MSSSNAAKQEARSLLIKYKLSNPTLDNLVYIVESLKFEIIDYSKDNIGSSLRTLINELSIQSLISQGKAFVYQNNSVKLLFVCDQMTSAEKRYAIAHELGHIILGHLNACCNENNVEEEFEANEFAHYLLTPGMKHRFIIWFSSHKLIAIIIGLVITACFITIPIINQATIKKSYTAGEYYVTETGEKYHEKDCIFTKDKTNIHRLTQADFDSGKYEPCQICLPDKF